MQRGIPEGNWLRASDFTTEGTTLTIDNVQLKNVAPDTEKFVMSFKETQKSLMLNEVNYRIIEKNTGEPEPSNWSGYKITLYSTTIKVKTVVTPCIRVKILVNSFAEKE